MADIEKLNDVAVAGAEAVNGVAVANIQAINGFGYVTTTTASRWAMTAINGYFAYAANSDLTSWTAYDAYDESGGASQVSGDGEFLAYGKNNSGNPIYVATRSMDSTGGGSGETDREIHYSTTDITDGDEWTNVDIDGDDSNKRHIQCVMWGARSDGTAAGTWMAVGKQNTGRIYRSVDGAANWSEVDISGLTGHSDGSNSAHYIQGIASDGAGKWMFAQGPRIYYSTDDGASWAVSTPFSTNAPGRNQGIVFTNNSWVVVYSRSSQIKFRSCAASDITDWGDEVANPSNNMSSPSNNSTNVKIAAANGNVVACSEDDYSVCRFTVSGKTIGTVSGVEFAANNTANGKCKGLATDGTKWVLCCQKGDLYDSTDNGASWTQRLDAFQIDGVAARNLAGIVGNVFYPL